MKRRTPEAQTAGAGREQKRRSGGVGHVAAGTRGRPTGGLCKGGTCLVVGGWHRSSKAETSVG